MCDRKGACLFFRLGTHVGCHDQFNTCTQTQPFIMAPYTVHKDVKHTHRNVRHVKWYITYFAWTKKASVWQWIFGACYL